LLGFPFSSEGILTDDSPSTSV